MSDMWNSVAPAWERQAEVVDTHLADATDALLDMTAVGPGCDVIDLACGTGGAGLAAADRVGSSGHVTLADIAEAMVAAAARRAGGRANVTTTVCDQLQVASPDDAFDVVLVRHGLMFAQEPATAAREALRVLRPGGRYGAMTWAGRDANPWLGLILDAVGSWTAPCTWPSATDPTDDGIAARAPPTDGPRRRPSARRGRRCVGCR